MKELFRWATIIGMAFCSGIIDIYIIVYVSSCIVDLSKGKPEKKLTFTQVSRLLTFICLVTINVILMLVIYGLKNHILLK
jgi:hypothetical protein